MDEDLKMLMGLGVILFGLTVGFVFYVCYIWEQYKKDADKYNDDRKDWEDKNKKERR
ncbi:hypothetical protein KAR91_14300 [Candidatus Pacearchaeota archaeon]|nr:hypothetical protein [Candidatus Pacearchaeota archaeon]